jgi:hypothetical protein
MSFSKIEYHFKGKRRYGAFITQDNGTKVYMAFRKHNDIYVESKGKISDALRTGVAAWAIDLSTLISARTKGCTMVAVRVKETGDMYFTNLSNFFVPTLVRTINYASKGGSLQKVLPLRHWKVVRAERTI